MVRPTWGMENENCGDLDPFIPWLVSIRLCERGSMRGAQIRLGVGHVIGLSAWRGGTK